MYYRPSHRIARSALHLHFLPTNYAFLPNNKSVNRLLIARAAKSHKNVIWQPTKGRFPVDGKRMDPMWDGMIES